MPLEEAVQKVYEFPSDFDPRLPSAVGLAPSQVDSGGKETIAAFDDTTAEHIQFVVEVPKGAKTLHIGLLGWPETWPGTPTGVIFRAFWKEVEGAVFDPDEPNWNGPEYFGVYECKDKTPERIYRAEEPFPFIERLAIPIKGGKSYRILLGRAPVDSRDCLLGDFCLARVLVKLQ